MKGWLMTAVAFRSIVLLLGLACALAAKAQTCQPLREAAWQPSGASQALIPLLQSALQPLGWSVASNAAATMQGPTVLVARDTSNAAEALRRIAEQLRERGEPIMLVADRSQCRVSLMFDETWLQKQRAPAVVSHSVSSAPESLPVTASTSAAEPLPSALRLVAGQRLAPQIERWLAPVGWKLMWDLEVDWVVPADVEMGTSQVFEALHKLAQWLHAEGRPVQFLAFETNKVVSVRALASLSARP
ncbi:MAG: TcpQ domain-containing protein [Rhodocyclaceae bacterium]|nr:TcpQ domain-containing protein [Rhodocyclaceae bacterium]